MFCPHCGKEIAEGQLFCQYCGTKLAEEGLHIVEAISAARSREKTPWEDRDAQGFFGGFFKTLNEVLFRPSEFFRNMNVTGGLTDPLLYALIIGMVGLMFSYLWQIAFKSAMHDIIPGMQIGADYMGRGIAMAILAFFTPFFVILGLFLSSGLLHVFLMFVKGARAGFEATFRVVAYGYSVNIFLILPFCGGIIAGVWAIVLAIIGLREAHQTTGGRAAVAVFLPLIVLCGLITLAVALFMGLAAASLGTIMQMQR